MAVTALTAAAKVVTPSVVVRVPDSVIVSWIASHPERRGDSRPHCAEAPKQRNRDGRDSLRK